MSAVTMCPPVAALARAGLAPRWQGTKPRTLIFFAPHLRLRSHISLTASSIAAAAPRRQGWQPEQEDGGAF